MELLSRSLNVARIIRPCDAQRSECGAQLSGKSSGYSHQLLDDRAWPTMRDDDRQRIPHGMGLAFE
jgi:hypothetical protein